MLCGYPTARYIHKILQEGLFFLSSEHMKFFSFHTTFMKTQHHIFPTMYADHSCYAFELGVESCGHFMMKDFTRSHILPKTIIEQCTNVKECTHEYRNADVMAKMNTLACHGQSIA